MSLAYPTSSFEPLPTDLLPLIRRSQVLSEGKYEEIRDQVIGGALPREPLALANQLVRSQVLTEYQAHRLLKNKPQSLVIGRYVILDRIGSGSMGRVYKARHLLMDRVVALKIIAPEYVSSPRKIARFQREIRLIGRLDHPNVVRAFDADRVSNVPYIVMEFVLGQTLGQRLRERGPLPPDEVAEFAAQAALGLAHAHEQGVLHRDIKPSNLLLNEHGNLKVLDFGLGILMEHEELDDFATRDGIAVGTIDYMSPEQTCGHAIDGRSDLYSLGCAMYHLMTQRLLFPGSSTIERLAARIKGQPVALADLHPELPPRLVQVMQKLLAPSVQERFQTAREAADALRSLSPRHAQPHAVGRIEERNGPGSCASEVARPMPAAESHPEANTPPLPRPASANTAPLPPLFRFLIFLAEQSLVSIVLGALTLLTFIFGAGFALAVIVR
jgi:eukaryotic-like serine/threonine-protein kinase